MDIIGIGLGFIGLLAFLSLFATGQSTITTWLANALFVSFGWGAYIFPLALLVLGAWLVLSKAEKIPWLTAERLVGYILIFINLLTWLDLFAKAAHSTAANAGGGVIGFAFERLLVNGLGMAAAVVVLIAWLLIGIILTLDIALLDFFNLLVPIFQKLGEFARRAWQEWKIERTKKPQVKLIPPKDPQDLPATFHPMQDLSEVPKATREKTRREKKPQIEIPVIEEEPEKPALVASSSSQARASWTLPNPKDILDPATTAGIQESVDYEVAHLIEETLASFGAPGHVVDIKRGPTITQYGIEPDFIETRYGRTRVRVSKITTLVDDLALALAAPRIRIQAPVPGKNYVGIEVPNREISRVTLSEITETASFKKLQSPVKFALGKDVSGKPIAVDLSLLPHLLIAGTTGSGKSVCINSILSSLLLYNTPADLRLVLVDPKRVELTGYNGIPHLLSPVVTDAEQVINALQWMTSQMDSRYHKFSKTGVRNIHEYNSHNPENSLPYLIVVIDELADLMMIAPDDTERSITRLAQLARATGIHLVLATQRPSTDVVTGLIKANFPARIAFAVASGVDSRVILDQPGAERLLGRGDMLFQAPDASAPVRLQGVYISEGETRRLVDYWRTESGRHVQAEKPTNEETGEDLPRDVPLQQTMLWEDKSEEEGDPLYTEAVDLVRREGRASVTMLQRRLRIGYTRAARLVDSMEEKGVISGKLPHTQTREVLDYGPAAPPADED
jgi:S-DNA-T family DNA segregation ATPase FtsK/SpoIIIE